jgi:hypothetical protein
MLATAPAADARTGRALVWGTLSASFSHSAAAPTVTMVTPHKGSAASATTVSITGTGLDEASAVNFGAAAAARFEVKSSTSISAVSPAGMAGTVDVTVTTPGGTSATSSKGHFTFVPAISSLSPSAGSTAGGTSVTISGAGFGVGSSGTEFRFGSIAATMVNCTSTTTCTVLTPGHRGSLVGVKATVNRRRNPQSHPADLFTYVRPPTLTAITPQEGPQAGGTSVSITGTSLTGTSAVKFGATGAMSFTVNSPTSITAVSPAGSGTVDVTVTTAGGTTPTSAADHFTYRLPPP